MSVAPPIGWVVGTFDTKAAELDYLASLLRMTGVNVVTVDIGTQSKRNVADIDAATVALHHPHGAAAVLEAKDRGKAVVAMGEALSVLVQQRLAAGGIQGILGVGGSGGSSMIAPAMRLLPIGIPKILVSTMAAGDVSAYVGVVDMTLMYSVTDIAGLNRLSRTILSNAAHALAGMLLYRTQINAVQDKPSIGLTMFGVTTPCVQAVRDLLQEDFDTQVFHANGAGGRTLETLAAAGMFVAIVDITTTEVGQHLAGGICDAGENRLDAAAQYGLPWVGSVGALDMINWGPASTIPAQYAGRTFHVHNADVTLMRSNFQELQAAGMRIAEQLNKAPGPVHLLLPLRGLSTIDAPGEPFYDPEANAVLFETLRELFLLSDTHRLIELPMHINDVAFAMEINASVRLLGAVLKV